MSAGLNMREVTVTRVEFSVPSGSEIKDIGIVQEWAWQDYARRNALDPKVSRGDNWCHVYARDEEIVFAFTVEKPVAIPDGWSGVTLPEAIRQAEEKHEAMLKWGQLFEEVKAQRDDKRDTLDRIRDLLVRSEGSLPPSWVAEVRAALVGAA